MTKRLATNNLAKILMEIKPDGRGATICSIAAGVLNYHATGSKNMSNELKSGPEKMASWRIGVIPSKFKISATLCMMVSDV